MRGRFANAAKRRDWLARACARNFTVVAVALATSACGVGLFATPAIGQAYPSRPIRLLLPFPPGGGSDSVARVVGQSIGTLLGQPVVIDNRAGASGNIAAELVVKANPDGYSLLFGNSSLSLAPAIYTHLGYDPARDLLAVSMVSSYPFVTVVHPSVPAQNLRELVALAKAKPGGLNYASAGVGTLGNFGMQLLCLKTDMKLNHVSYKGGGPAILSTVAGEIQVATLTLAAVQVHIRTGKLRGIGVMDKARSATIPQVPTIAEGGVEGVEVLQWNGIFVNSNTPAPIVDRLHAATVKAVADPEMRQRLAAEGANPVGNSPTQFAAFFKKETKIWTEVARKANIRIGQ